MKKLLLFIGCLLGLALTSKGADYTLYVYNNTGWENPTVYAWGNDEEIFGGWSGAALTEKTTIDNVEYLYISFGDNTGKTENLIFSNNGSNQLADFTYTINDDLYLEITLEGATKIDPDNFTPSKPVEQVSRTIYAYNNLGWETLNLYIWASGDYENASWPGVAPSGTQKVNNVDYSYFTLPASLDYSNVNLIFNNGTNQLDNYNITINKDLYVELSTEGVKEVDPATFSPVAPTWGEAPEKLYVMGTIEGNQWDPAKAVAFTAGETTGIFTITNVNLVAGGEEDPNAYVTFINITESNVDNIWDELNDGQHRYGPLGGGSLSVGSNAFYLVGDVSWSIEPGTYDFTVNFNDGTVTVSKSQEQGTDEDPEEGDKEDGDKEENKPNTPTPTPETMATPAALYLVGNLEATKGEWDPNAGVALTKTNDSFAVTGVELVAADKEKVAFFALINVKTEDWTTVNDGQHRYGPSADGEVTLGKASTFELVKEASWSIEPGVYDFAVDFTKATLTVTAAASDAIFKLGNDANAPIEYYNLQGVRVANPTHGIYIIRQGNTTRKVVL